MHTVDQSPLTLAGASTLHGFSTAASATLLVQDDEGFGCGSSVLLSVLKVDMDQRECSRVCSTN